MARRWVPGRGVLALAVATVLAAAPAGCSGGVGPGSESLGGSVSREIDGGDDAAPSTASSPTPADPTTTAPVEPTTEPDDDARGDDAAAAAAFAFVPWGPDDPPVPQRYAALAASATGEPACGDAASNALPGPFWELAVEVCDALAGTGPWPATTAVPSPPPARNAYEACLDAELAAMLERALRARAASSDLPPVPHFAAPGTLSPCQTAVFEARALTAADGYGADVVPAGSVAVQVMAGSADVTSSVTVGGLPAEVLAVEPASGAATLVVVVAAPAEPTTASLTVTTTRGTLSATVALPAAPSPTEADPGEAGDAGDAGVPAPTDPADPADPGGSP